jgi:hypothetical protein
MAKETEGNNDMRQLPPVKIPEQFYELIRLYAFQNHLSVSGAVRQLLITSSTLRDLANERGIVLKDTIAKHGGRRLAQQPITNITVASVLADEVECLRADQGDKE